MKNRAIASLLAGLALTVGVAAPAHADGPRMRLERADVDKYPLSKLYVTYVESDGRIVTGKSRDAFKLQIDSNDQGTAADAKPVEQTGEPIFLVIVVQVSGAMTETIEDVKRGVKTLAHAAGELGPSQVALIAYAQDVKRIAEFSKPAEIDGKAAALQIDTDGTEVHLVDAVRTGIDLLNSKVVPDGARKLIVVFSDGIDVSGSDKKPFTELGKRALLAGNSTSAGATGAPIIIDTIGLGLFEPAKLKNLTEMTKQSNGTERLCKSAQDVGAQFDNTADEIKKQYVLLFQSNILGDSKEHTLQVVDDNGGKAVYSNNVTKILVQHDFGPKEETPFYKKWWFWTAIGAGLVLIVVLILMLRGSSEERPVEVGPAPQMNPEMPMQGGGYGMPQMAAMGGNSNRTMALDLGALSGKGPTIGWIVGITGKYADQTFKLKAGGRTLVGTAPDCDVVIDDSFMSSKHCEVQYDGNSYKIIDLGSTNGVVLNDKKVMTAELVDGDTIRLGRTEFRFKAIN